MSSPITINRPSTPSSSSEASSYASTSFSSSSSASEALTYTREALLALATSPLAQTRAPEELRAFPEIMRSRRRGLVEAHQALEYNRNVSLKPDSPRKDNSGLYRSSTLDERRLDGVYISPARRTLDEGAQRRLDEGVYIPPALRGRKRDAT